MPKKKICPPSTSVDIQNIEECQQSVEVHMEEVDMSEALEVEVGNRIHVEEEEEFDIDIHSLVAYCDDRNSARPSLSICYRNMYGRWYQLDASTLTISDGNLLTMVLVKTVNL